MPDLSIQVQEIKEVPHTAIVQLTGSIDAKTVISFQNELSAVKQRGISRFVLDMESVKYINSTGLGFLINLADSIGPSQGAVALVKVQPKVKVVFDMLGLNAFFKIYNTRKDALQYFAQPGVVEASAQTVVAKGFGAEAGARPGPVIEGAGRSAGSTASADAQAGIECQVCRARLVVPEPGTYKCPRCATVFMYQGESRANFLVKRKLSPVQLSLTCSEECLEGLSGFVHALAKKAGLSAETAKSFDMAVRDAVETLREHAFEGNSLGTYHVLLLAADSELEMRLADSGKTLKDNGQSYFALARQVMDRFEHRPHPKGGNLLTMAKKTSPGR